jgi:phosphoribosylaminoimidazolecarboxamide formyltransferase/IMP cyclohydrolase
MARAIVSVSDKTGVVEFARGLVDLGWEVLSTGGTAAALRQAGVPVTDVSAVTHHPEMMEGRVKTLHPAVHGGLLARRDNPEDLKALGSQGYELIDLVAVNLYPFAATVTPETPIPQAMEQVDIGGPSMLRSAAKNHRFVLPVVDPADYPRVLDALRNGEPENLRVELARKVFEHTSLYDGMIAAYFGFHLNPGAMELRTESPMGNVTTRTLVAIEPFPQRDRLNITKVQELRYGENPDQSAAFYAEGGAPPGSLPSLEQLHGKELSFNNLLDTEAAVTAASAWAGEAEPVCVIVKHNTPCGIAVGPTVAAAWESALRTDPVSAYGGIAAYSQPVDAAAAVAMGATFLEIVVAPDYAPDALEILRRKKNLRILRLPVEVAAEGERDYKRVRGGFLVQQRMRMSFPEDAWKVVTRRQPTPAEMDDLRFAWRVVAAVKSNAIVIARDRATLGIGAGQTSRVDSSRIAVMKAGDRGLDLHASALASDAFFPFRDGVDAAAEAGVRAVIEPGGSVRDEEVIAAANEHGIAMVFTGRRLFRH